MGLTPLHTLAPGSCVSIAYTNHRGVKAIRHLKVISLQFGSTEWHPEPQWLLEAHDAGKNAVRTFALKDAYPIP